MNKTELIQKIKLSLQTLFKFSSQVTLSDGSVIVSDDSEIVDGSAVTFEDGSDVPDGDYEMEDGTAITITAGVVSISDTEMATEAPAENTPAEETAETPAEEATEDADTENRITALEAQVAQILDILNTMSGASTTMMSKIDKLAAAPADKPVEFSAIEKKVSGVVSDVRSELELIRELNKKNK